MLCFIVNTIQERGIHHTSLSRTTIMVDKIFTPVRIGQFDLPHRIVLAPLTRYRSDEGQVPKEFVAEYYVQRASSRGLLITEATSIHEDAARFEGSPGIYSEEQIKAWQMVTNRYQHNLIQFKFFIIN